MDDGSDQLYSGPDGTALRFFERATKNNFQSEKNGRPIFDTSLLVEVMVPGSRESTPQFEVERTYCTEAGTDAKGNRLVERGAKYAVYASQIEAYKSQNGDGTLAGTPLNQWPTIDSGTAATLRASGIFTVEGLASVQDTFLSNLGIGGRVLRDQAAAFLQTRQFAVPTATMSADMSRLREENGTLRLSVDDLTMRLSDAMAQLQAARTGQPIPTASPANAGNNSGSMLNDPLSPVTPSQPNPLASGTGASPLAPTGGEQAENAKKEGDDKFGFNAGSPGNATGTTQQPPQQPVKLNDAPLI